MVQPESSNLKTLNQSNGACFRKRTGKQPHRRTGTRYAQTEPTNQEVKDVHLRGGGGDVVALQSAPPAPLALSERAHSQLEDEHLARLGEQERHFRGYHVHLHHPSRRVSNIAKYIQLKKPDMICA